MPISSNRRQRVIEFATPKVADLVVVERVDASKNVNSAATADDNAYGTAHPDTTRFPNFKLALIKNGDNDQGQFQDWYYVKDRANQDDYNWEFQAAGAGSPRFDTVVRTYVLPRADGGGTGGVTHFDESLPALASAMPTTTNDPFGDGIGDADPNTDSSYILFEKKQVRSGDETLDTLFVVEQRVYVKRVTLVSVDSDKQFPYSGYNVSGDPYGGLISKETLYYRDEVVYATVDFSDSDEDTAGIQTGGYRVFSVHNSDAAKKKAEYIFTDKDAVYQYSTGGSPDTYNFWGIDPNGVMREGKQLSDNWYALSERQVIRKDSDGLVAEYFTNQNMGWPAVFSNLYATVWNRRDGGKHTNVYPVYKREAYNGPTKTKVQIYWQKAPFAEPTAEAGSNTALCLLKPMEPMEMEFVTPNWRVKTKPCLHNNVTVTYTNGTEDPVWNYGGYTATWKPTNYIDWCHPAGGSASDTIVISDSQEAFRGGYLRTKVTAYKPNITTTDDANRHSTEGAPSGPVLDA
tara:strand:+ start:935 stop:2485 length:1551 start_codon:yes stop_codon:yes gene_type:complete